jgi:anti-sigma B factor antagonist
MPEEGSAGDQPAEGRRIGVTAQTDPAPCRTTSHRFDHAVTTRDESSPVTGEFEPFRIDVEPARDFVRVAPVGELDIATVEKLRAEVGRLRESGFTNLVLDLRGVRFLDSTGLRLVLELDAAAREAGQELEIIRGSAVVQRIFDVTQVSDRLNFVDP